MRQLAARPQHQRLGQRGQVVLGILAILGIGFGMAFYTFHGPTGSTVERDKITDAALVQARDALIGYAAGQKSGGSYRPGDLPCPDRNDNGQDDDGNCNTVVGQRIGRLPWKTLGLPDLRDSAGERLWYAVSNNFQDNSRNYPLNSDTLGEYTITGLTGPKVIAVVFSPGTALGTQDRSTTATALCTTTSTTIVRSRCAANYLDGINGSGTSTFTTALIPGTSNDKLMLITSDFLFAAVTSRVAKEILNALESYYVANGVYPRANPYADGTYSCNPAAYDGRLPLNIKTTCGDPPFKDWGALPTWYAQNQWQLLTHYGVSQACTNTSGWSPALCDIAGGDPWGFFGVGPPLTISGVTSYGRLVVLVSGPALGSEVHPCASAAQCLEDGANSDGNATYTKPSRLPTGNDRMAVSCGTWQVPACEPLQ